MDNIILQLGVLCVLFVGFFLAYGLWLICAALFRLIVPKDRPAAPARALLPPRWQACPYCGRAGRRESLRCDGCGLDRARAIELRELAIAERQLTSLRTQHSLDPAAFEQVRNAIHVRRRTLIGQMDALVVEPHPPLWQQLEKTLAGCHDPRALAADVRERVLAWYGQLADEQLRRLSVPAQRALARLLATRGRGGDALLAYRRLIETYPDDPTTAETALEAGCLAATEKQFEQGCKFLERALAGRLPPQGRREAETLLRLCGGQPAAPVSPPVQPVPPVVRPPRKSFTELLAAFMEERNILWGELLGGLLMVGCSVALVISLWHTLERIPYFPFLVLAGSTAAIFGAGFYTLHHWKLEATSRGLLVIASLLVPLDLLVLAGLSRGDSGGLLALVTEAGALVLFAVLVHRAARVLVPEGAGLLTLAVLGTAATQLLVPRLLEFRQPAPEMFALLGGAVAGLHGLATGGFLLRCRDGAPLPRQEANGLIRFLGLAAFALAAALGFLVYWGGDVGLSLERLAVAVVLAGVPALAAGLVLQRGPKEEVELAFLRTAGTGIALAGMLLLLLAIVLAWPQPTMLVPVCLLDFAILTAIAFAARLPWVQAAALPCLVAGYLTGYHWLTGRLDGDRVDLAGQLLAAVPAPDGGAPLVGLALASGFTAELLVRLRRRLDGAYYAAGAGGAALLGFVAVSLHGFEDPARTMAISAVCAAGVLVFNLRWQRLAVSYLGVALVLVATFWCLQWRYPSDARPWAVVLAVESAALATLAVVLRRFPTWTGMLANPCREVAVAAAGLALLIRVTPPESPWITCTLGVLAVTAFLLACAYALPGLTWVGSGLTLYSIGHAFVWRLAGLTVPYPLVGACLLHAALAWLTGLRLETVPSARRLYARPLGDSSLVSSVAAVLVLFVLLLQEWPPDEPVVCAVYAGWLAALWLTAAWFGSRPGLFVAFQAASIFAVLFGVLAWVEWQPWVSTPADLVRDPRSWQAYGVGLAGLCLLGMTARLRLRAHAHAQTLLDSDWPQLDRLLLGLLVLGLAISVVWGIVPDLAGELLPGHGAGQASARTAALGPGAWLLLAALAATLTVGLWERHRGAAVLGLLLLALIVPVLVAGPFRAEGAAASALRWGLAVSFLGCSILVGQRQRLRQVLARLGGGGDFSDWVQQRAQSLLLLAGLGPTLGLTAMALVLRAQGVVSPGPHADSVFHGLGWFASQIGPVVFLTLGLASHAARERSAGYVFAAGLGLNLTAALLVWRLHDGMPLTAWWVPLVQANALVSAMLALVWLRRTRPLSTEPAAPLLTAQVALGAVGVTGLLLWVLVQLFVHIGGRVPLDVLQAGQFGGWLAFFLAFAAVAGLIHWTAPQRAVHVWGSGGLLLGLLTAAWAARWDSSGWLAHHVLTTTWALTGLGLLIVGWAGADLRLIGPLFWSVARRAESAERLAQLFPLIPTRRWVQYIAALVVGLALRGAWSDPARPNAAVVATLAASALLGALALWSRRAAYVYASGFLVNMAATLLWEATWLIDHTGFVAGPTSGPGILDSFLYTQVWALAVASAFWSLLETALRSRTPPLVVACRGLPFRHTAALLGLHLLVILIVAGVASDLTDSGVRVAGERAWTALAAVVLALGLCLWDPNAPFTPVALRAAGLLGVGLLLHSLALPAPELGWTAVLLLALFVLLTAGCHGAAPRLEERLRLPEDRARWPETWVMLPEILVAGVVAGLSVWASLDAGTMTQRATGPLAVLLLLPAAVLLAEYGPAAWYTGMRWAALALGVLAVAEGGWGLVDADGPTAWMHRMAWLLMTLAAMTGAYRVGPPRLVPGRQDWIDCARQLGPVLLGIALIVLGIVVAQEFLFFDPDPAVRRTPMAAWAVGGVTATLLGLIAAGVAWALTPAADPFNLPARRRTLYVYAGEVLLALLFVHLRLNVPWLFPRIPARFWPLVAMAVAYVGAGVSELFNRRGWPTLSVPLRYTGVALPLLPLAAFWAKPPAVVYALADNVLPGLHPLLRYLDALPHNFGDHAAIWLLLGLLYAFVAVTSRSFHFAVAAALAANFGLWALLVHTGVGFLVHPQLWLIPLALIILVAGHLNRDRLTAAQAQGLRFVGLMLLYVSSTADMFIAGLGNSVLLPLVLALLSVLGVLTGILLRVRAFLVLGFAFLCLVIFSQIWHAAVDLYQTWVWWASGIVLGAAILALFGVFEKRRQEVLRLLDEVKTWE